MYAEQARWLKDGLDGVRAPGDGRPPRNEVVVRIFVCTLHNDPFVAGCPRQAGAWRSQAPRLAEVGRGRRGKEKPHGFSEHVKRA